MSEISVGVRSRVTVRIASWTAVTSGGSSHSPGMEPDQSAS
ncbi:hypothetical protein [Sphaerisporangium sp. NPDC051011]